MNRREFMVGAVAVAAVPLLPPVVDSERWVRGIKYQDWPFGTERPQFHHFGSIDCLDGFVRELSYFVGRVNKYSKELGKPYYWEAIEWERD